ncbi:AAA family ATPase [Plantactinospora sp. B6F1]|uniref:helix-turn-helix transcriptional regulator n=1 Tax=Plantactinospora sp. B6F1 TaxID=3158971 RepID=UPI0032D9076E
MPFDRVFVGRDAELTALARALARPPAVLLVEGEAGIGKSWLVRELLASPEGRRHRCLTMVCPPFREPFTLGPVVDAIRQAVDHVAGLRLSGLAGTLRPLFPEWAGELPPAPEPLEDARASRHRLFRALVEVLDKLGVTVLVAEDTHWADEATIEFLMFVAARPARPMSLVVTYRPEDVSAGSLLPRLTSRAPAGATFIRLSLAGLDAARTGELVSAMLGGEAVSGEFTELVCRRTGGIPFVIEQLVRLLYDRADLVHEGGHWMRRELTSIEVPPTVRDAVLERVGRLPPEVGGLLRAAAVLGDPVDEATLLAVADPPDAEGALGAALESGLLVVDRGTIAPRHALAATAIYDTIPVGRRRELHLRAGQILESVTGQPVERLAYHFRRAGQLSRWCRYAELAAARALDAGDHTSAVSLLRDLLANADRADRSVLRLVSTIEVSSVRPPGRYTELTDALRSMLDRLDLPPDQRAQVRFPLARLLILAKRDEEGRVELLRVVPDVRDDPAIASRAMLALAIPAGLSCSVAEHLRWLRRAAALPRPADRASRLAYQVNEASALLALGLDEGWVAARDLPDDATTAAERHALASARVNMADAAMRWGWYDRATAHLADAAALADRVQDAGIHDMIRSTGCHVDWYVGQWKGLAERARAIDGDDDALWPSRLEARLVAGLMLRVTGAIERAAQAFESVLADRHAELSLVIGAAAHLGQCWLERGSPEHAARVTEAPVAVLRSKRVWMWATELVPVRVDALLATGQHAEAANVVDWFGRGLRGREMPAPRAALAWCRAALAAHRGDVIDAARRYSRVAAAWQEMSRPYGALLAEERRAGCLLAAGREPDALAALMDAHEGLVHLGARPDADRVARQLGEHGIRIRPNRRGRRGYGGQISPREMEVLRLLVTGKTNREIGQALSRSPKTVAAQLNSAMRKLGVTSRTALAVSVLDLDRVPAVEDPAAPID